MVSTTGLFVLCFLFVAIQALQLPQDYKRFDAHKLLLLQVRETDDYHFLEYQLHNNFSLDFWIEPRFGEVAIRVGPEYLESFTQELITRNIQYEVIIDDVQQAVEEQLEGIPLGDETPKGLEFNVYNRLAAIHAWLRELATSHPKLVTLVNLGKSYQGRDLLAIKISNSDDNRQKKIAWFDGGIHAREWISPATVIWMANELIQGFIRGDEDCVYFLNHLEVYVLPVFNPDGYEYTFTNDRMWRKTRRPNPNNSCVGTDPNRNWNNHWAEQGISHNPCAETFCGPTADSEIEVATVSNYIRNLNSNNRVKGYINFHAYSQLWLSPYGWTGTPCGHHTQIDRTGRDAATALRSWYNTVYTVGPIFTTIYPASGSSADFAYDNAKIIYSYAPELRPASGSPGFLLPASQIIPSGEETFAALSVWLHACVSAQ